MLGGKGSNLRMAGPKPAALPLGDRPIKFNFETYFRALLILYLTLECQSLKAKNLIKTKEPAV